MPDPRDDDATIPAKGSANQRAKDSDTEATLPAKSAKQSDTEATLPAQGGAKKPAPAAAAPPVDPRDLAATRPATSDPGATLSANDLLTQGAFAKTTPAKAADLAATKPAAPHAPKPTDLAATKPAPPATNLAETAPSAPRDQRSSDLQTVVSGAKDATQAGTRPSTIAETLMAGTGAAATAPASGGAVTQGATQAGGSLTGTFSRTQTRLSRTRVNSRLQPQDQHLDQQLQLSRTSVLTDMATLKASAPVSLRNLAEAQGTDARYAIDRPLAAGGMGAVLKIEDNDFRRGAAMKIIHSKYADDANALERFLAEAQVTAQLEHPNIVPIHDLGVMADGTLYFTMKLIEGMSLGDVVKLRRIHRGLLKQEDWFAEKRRKEEQKPADERKTEAQLRDEWEADRRKGAELDARFDIEEIILIFLKVLDGVGFAHARDVVHRDIKPDNLMLGAHGEVLVVDWGIAKVLKQAGPDSEVVQKLKRQVISIRGEQSLSATMDGSAMGTIYYMPPEQAAGELDKIDGRSDIYALGATLYELLCLKRSLEVKSLNEALALISSGGWTALNENAPDLDQDLVAIVHQAMALDRDKRYATCEAFADDLRRYLAGQAVLARQRNLIERIGRWVSAHKLQVQAGAAAVVLMGAAAGGTWWYSASANERAYAARIAEAERLLGEGETTNDLAKLESASNAISQAKERRLTLRVGELETQITNAIKQEKTRQAAELAARASADTAARLLAECDQHEQAGSYEQALESINLALKATPGDTTLMDRREKLRGFLADKLAAEQRKAAVALVSQASDRLDQIEKSDLGEAPAAQALDGVKEVLLKLKELPTVPGATELIARHSVLATNAKNAAARKERMVQAAPHKQRALVALSAGKLADAREAHTQAKALVPEDPELAVFWEHLVQAEALAAEQARQAQVEKERQNRLILAREKAAGFLAQAKLAAAAMDEARAKAQAAEAKAEERRVRLLAAPVDQQGPYLTALAEVKEAKTTIAESWAKGEGEATSAIAALAEFPEDPLVGEVKSLLSDLYANRLREARRSRSGPEIRAFTNLLARTDVAGRYARELKNFAALTVVGAPADATIRPVVEQQDGRLMAQGEAKPLPATAQELPAGAYELRSGKLMMTVGLTAERPLNLQWPGKLPTIKNLPLAYVSAADGGKGFLLSVTEVTSAWYAEFLNEDTQLTAVNEAVSAWRDSTDPKKPAVAPLPLVPMSAKGLPFGFKAIQSVDGISIGRWEAINGSAPIAKIDRPAAEAWCAWMSTRSGMKVRLPAAREWQQAATGGDDRRVYPWGQTFLSAFTISSITATGNMVQPVGSVPADVGPFGHLDLGGNLREWLADTFTANEKTMGLLAGGAFGDSEERVFRSTATEAVETAAQYPSIGFRVLVELP